MLELVEDLVLANRILSHEGVLDAFGHVSIRHPGNPMRYLISRAVSPATVTSNDIVELDLDGEPVGSVDQRLYGERVIHGAIYRSRSDVAAICHHHDAAVLPFAGSGVPIVPVCHLGATLGPRIPFWDSQDQFGDTNLLVTTAEEGASLARSLGADWAVLLRHHGAVVAGRSIKELVSRCIHLSNNAKLQLAMGTLGPIHQLSDREIELSGEFNLRPHVLDRVWNNCLHTLSISSRNRGDVA